MSEPRGLDPLGPRECPACYLERVAAESHVPVIVFGTIDGDRACAAGAVQPDREHKRFMYSARSAARMAVAYSYVRQMRRMAARDGMVLDS